MEVLSETTRSSSLFNAAIIILVHEKRREYNCVPKVKQYVQQTVNFYSMDDFRSIFRLSRHGFQVLLEELAPTPAFTPRVMGRPGIDISHQCLLALKYLATQESLLSIGTLFGVTKSSAFYIVHRFCNAVIPKLSASLIKWPSHEEQLQIASAFSNKSRMPPVVIGAVDSRENPFLKPRDNHESYFNRKHFHSIKIQAICNADSLYMDVFIGWPGRSHDARTFLNSPIFKKLSDENILREGFCILGDSAYPLKEWLLTPYKDSGALTLEKRLFNLEHSRVRQVIECAFGRTVERFRRLKFLYSPSIAFCVKVCLTACTLHNFCGLANEEQFEYTIDPSNNQTPAFNIFTADVLGNEKRDSIANTLLAQ
jgi:hypothetical protein